MMNRSFDWRWLAVAVIACCAVAAGICFALTFSRPPGAFPKPPEGGIQNLILSSPLMMGIAVIAVISSVAIGVLYPFTGPEFTPEDMVHSLVGIDSYSHRHPLTFAGLAGLAGFLFAGTGPMLGMMVNRHIDMARVSLALHRGGAMAELAGCAVAVLIGGWMLLSGDE